MLTKLRNSKAEDRGELVEQRLVLPEALGTRTERALQQWLLAKCQLRQM